MRLEYLCLPATLVFYCKNATNEKIHNISIPDWHLNRTHSYGQHATQSMKNLHASPGSSALYASAERWANGLFRRCQITESICYTRWTKITWTAREIISWSASAGLNQGSSVLQLVLTALFHSSYSQGQFVWTSASSCIGQFPRKKSGSYCTLYPQSVSCW